MVNVVNVKVVSISISECRHEAGLALESIAAAAAATATAATAVAACRQPAPESSPKAKLVPCTRTNGLWERTFCRSAIQRVSEDGSKVDMLKRGGSAASARRLARRNFGLLLATLRNTATSPAYAKFAWATQTTAILTCAEEECAKPSSTTMQPTLHDDHNNSGTFRSLLYAAIPRRKIWLEWRYQRNSAAYSNVVGGARGGDHSRTK
eukprot:5827410-Pleurochrysis_carterae.AAC.2